MVLSGRVGRSDLADHGDRGRPADVRRLCGPRLRDRSSTTCTCLMSPSPTRSMSPTVTRRPHRSSKPARVYVHFGCYGTACVDTSTGQVLWQRRDLPCNHWRGPGSSPILFEDLLIIHFDGYDLQYVVALDKATGATRWKTDRDIDYGTDDGDLKKAFCTPTIISVQGTIAADQSCSEGGHCVRSPHGSRVVADSLCQPLGYGPAALRAWIGVPQ